MTAIFKGFRLEAQSESAFQEISPGRCQMVSRADMTHPEMLACDDFFLISF